MTTAQDHHDAQLAAIKARHAEVRARVNDPAVTVGHEVRIDGDISMQQAGLTNAFLDDHGRTWRQTNHNSMILIADPTDVEERLKFIETFLAL